MSVLVQRIFKGRDNATTLNFTYVGEDGTESDIDLTPVTAADIIVHGANAGADVLLTSSSLTMTFSATGEFKAFLGDATLDNGEFFVTVIFYDVGHPDGQVMIHKDELRKLQFMVVDVSA